MNQLITRNIIEIVTKQELEDLVKSKTKPSCYIGYEVSGPVHLGHMSSMRKLKDLSEAGFDCTVLLADYHTYINKKGNMEWIQGMVEYWKAMFKAFGVKAKYVKGTNHQETKEYQHDIMRAALDTTIKRGLRSMQEVARDVDCASISQIIYPLMQSVDIKYLGVDVAVGGMDQRKIHMLARDLLPRIDYKAPVCMHYPLLVSLQGPETKMSSSKPNTMIQIHDDEKTIEKRVGSAFCPAKQAEDNPVMQMAQLVIFPETGILKVERDSKYGGDLEFKTYKELEKAYLKDLHPQDLKKAVIGSLVKILEKPRKVFGKNPEFKKLLNA